MKRAFMSAQALVGIGISRLKNLRSFTPRGRRTPAESLLQNLSKNQSLKLVAIQSNRKNRESSRRIAEQQDGCVFAAGLREREQKRERKKVGGGGGDWKGSREIREVFAGMARVIVGVMGVEKATSKVGVFCQGLKDAQKTTQWRSVNVGSLRLQRFASTLASSRGRQGLAVRVEAAAAGALEEGSVTTKHERKDEKSVIVIDNYDSFTYNLCQYLGNLGCKIEVYRNDDLTVEELRLKNPRGILISPGPGTPQDSGISLETVVKLGPSIPLFGVCMGLQCMGEAYGGKIVRAPKGVMHGKTSAVFYDEKGEPGLLDGLPNPFTACRYHSLVIEEESFPSDQLEITAWTEDGLVMGVRHRIHKHIQGVQFHPESIRTENGMQIVGNFLKLLEKKEAEEQALANASTTL